MKSTYKLTSTKLEGYFLISFEDDRLKGFEIEFKEPLTVAQFSYFVSRMPFNEEGLKAYEQLGLSIEQVAAPNEKIALFCRIYEKHVGIKYKVSPADSGKIKHVQIDDILLHHYFRSDNFLWKGKYSIANLVKYYNELRADMAQGGKAKFPDDWQPELIKKLSPQETMQYYRHLRDTGMQMIKSATGQVIGFK